MIGYVGSTERRNGFYGPDFRSRVMISRKPPSRRGKLKRLALALALDLLVLFPIVERLNWSPGDLRFLLFAAVGALSYEIADLICTWLEDDDWWGGLKKRLRSWASCFAPNLPRTLGRRAWSAG